MQSSSLGAMRNFAIELFLVLSTGLQMQLNAKKEKERLLSLLSRDTKIWDISEMFHGQVRSRAKPTAKMTQAIG
jgi:hypothetical protein